MKIILFLFCICLVAQLQAQHTKDSLNQQKEVLLISPGRSSIQDTSKRKVLRDSIFQQKESNVSELFIIGKKLTKKEKRLYQPLFFVQRPLERILLWFYKLCPFT